jgi:hypothetical protein
MVKWKNRRIKPVLQGKRRKDFLGSQFRYWEKGKSAIETLTSGKLSDCRSRIK